MAAQNIFIEAGHNTPEVNFNSSTGKLALTGKSIPENATRIFSPLIDWIREYVKNPQERTNLHLDLEYFNTASSIWFAKMYKELSMIDNHERLLIIHLYFNLEDYDEMDEPDLAEIISPVTDVLKTASVSIGVKIYGKDDSDTIIKERLILF
jgi:hypothetical protein